MSNDLLQRLSLSLALTILAALQLSAEEGPLRLHVETDRPIYHIGDPVLTRVVAVDALSRAPRSAQILRLHILDPQGNELENLAIGSRSGMSGLRWNSATLARGGTYTIRVRDDGDDNAPWSSRTFHIADHRQQAVSASIHFAQDSVAPGETLSFSISAKALNEGAATPTQIRVSGVVDGVMVLDQSWAAGGASSHPASIDIPPAVRLGGSLAVTIDDSRGGSTTVARSLPIAVSGVQVETRIPGGGLVAGLPARVYAQAHLPDGRPASLRARIIDATDTTVAELHSEHEGRGSSSFIPQAGGQYRLRVDAPAGVDDSPLPAVAMRGVSLHGSSDAQLAGQDLSLRMAASPAQRVSLEVLGAGIVLHRQSVDLRPEVHDLRIDAAAIDADGVLELRLRDVSGEILATRRIFRHPAPSLQLHWIDAPNRLREGERATITLEVRDAQGEAVPNALVSLRLRNAGISGLRAQRDRHPSLTSMLLLEQEVAELADPEVYLEGNAAADRRLELLLSCQGLALVPPPAEDWEDLAPEAIAAVMSPQVLRKGDVPAPSSRAVNSAETEGRSQAVSSVETGGSGAFMAIGAGGGASGMFGNRNGGGRKRALGMYGGSRASETAVEAALRLFMQVQEPDGRWRVGEIPAPSSQPGPPNAVL